MGNFSRLACMLAAVMAPQVAMSFEIEFTESSESSEIATKLLERLSARDDRPISFHIKDLGEFEYSPPLADGNKSHPWHAAAIAEEESKNYNIIKIRISGADWFYEMRPVKKIGDLGKAFSNRSDARKPCAIIYMDDDALPFAQKGLFAEINRLTHGRYVFAIVSADNAAPTGKHARGGP